MIKANTIITLINNEKYLVLNETEYEGSRYLLLMGMDDNKEVVSSKVGIFKEHQKEDLYVEKIENPELIIKLTKILKEQI